MAGSNPPGPLGTAGTPRPDDGTLARMRTPQPGTVSPPTVAAAKPGAGAQPAAPAVADPAIEALNLRGAARRAAYALKKVHPAVKFTSGRRGKEDQARAMASNVVSNRKWIEQTYRATPISAATAVAEAPPSTSVERRSLSSCSCGASESET